MERDGGAPAATVDDRPDDTPEPAADHSVDAELMQNRLREKEQLIAALTERLEQAAEQLDRLRRTGVDKGRRPLGGGFPAEVIEDHKNTLEDLKRVIARWEDMQAGASLGRIEAQIVELRDLMAGSAHAAMPSIAHSMAHAAASAAPQAAPSTPHRERAAEASATQPAAKPGGNAWWEAQKAALLGEPVPEPAQAEPAPLPAESNVAEEDRNCAEDRASSDLAELGIPDLPAPIDYENITLDQAREALRERDRLIQQLREPLILLKASGQLPADIHSLDNVPEAFKTRIAELEAQWQAKFRQVELDVSLERARLAREQAAVRQQQEALQKQIRQGGPSARAAGEDGAKGDDSSSKRRWFRFMGKTGDEGEGADQAEPDK